MSINACAKAASTAGPCSFPDNTADRVPTCRMACVGTTDVIRLARVKFARRMSKA